MGKILTLEDLAKKNNACIWDTCALLGPMRSRRCTSGELEKGIDFQKRMQKVMQKYENFFITQGVSQEWKPSLERLNWIYGGVDLKELREEYYDEKIKTKKLFSERFVIELDELDKEIYHSFFGTYSDLLSNRGISDVDYDIIVNAILFSGKWGNVGIVTNDKGICRVTAEILDRNFSGDLTCFNRPYFDGYEQVV